MEIKKVKSKLTSMLLAVVILLVNFNFLPVQSMINQSMSTGTVVAMLLQQNRASGLRKATESGGISILTVHIQKTTGNISTAIGITLM